MKKFKVLKSRSSLWREARNLAEVQPESHVGYKLAVS